MKTICALILTLLLNSNFIAAQDTLYVYKGGNIIYKSEVSKIDSAGFVHINYPPVVTNIEVTIMENSSKTIPVLANAFDPEGDIITLVGITNPAHGTGIINASGSVTYTPTADYTGKDSFTFTIGDGDGGVATGLVSVNVDSLVPYTRVTPRLYYIAGLGDGLWNNSTSGLGRSLIPLSIVSGNKYNSDGDGEFTFTGYFTTSRGFKLIRDIGSWSEYWGMSGSMYSHNGGDNIAVPSDGYYTLTLNSIANTLSIIRSTVIPPKYNTIGLIGDFSGWIVDKILLPTETTNNHVWYSTDTINFTADGTGNIFRANGNWDSRWGDSTFPYGISTTNVKNIVNKAGNYKIIFNDIDGTYYFFKQ